jgi:hypothetical protein
MWIHFNIINSSDEKIWKLVYGWFFGIYHIVFLGGFQRHFLLYGCPRTFSNTILKPTTSFPSLTTSILFYYLFPFLLTISILIITSFFFLPHQYINMKRQINMCLFMSKIFILIQIKFDIHINNEKLLETMWKHKKKKSWSSLLVHSNYYSLILCVNIEINSIGFFFLF